MSFKQNSSPSSAEQALLCSSPPKINKFAGSATNRVVFSPPGTPAPFPNKTPKISLITQETDQPISGSSKSIQDFSAMMSLLPKHVNQDSPVTNLLALRSNQDQLKAGLLPLQDLLPQRVNQNQPKVGLLPPKFPAVHSMPELSPELVFPCMNPPKTIVDLAHSSKALKKVEKFLEKSPDLKTKDRALWINPSIYESVEVVDSEEFPVTVRLKQDLSPKTIQKMSELFKTSWYEPRGIHGIQTTKIQKALERFLIAHYLEEGRLSYHDILELNLKKKLEKDRNKYEELLDSE